MHCEDYKPYTPEARMKAIEIIREMRSILYTTLDLEKRWTRLKDDEVVFYILESMFTEVQFLGDKPYAAICALDEAAEADRWYMMEKDYGYDYYDDDCEMVDEALN